MKKKSHSILIKKGYVFSPLSKTNQISVKDILIKDKIIAEISDDIKEGADEVIYAEDMLVSPGFVDLHCHLREPGFEHKEDIESGTMSALAGGFTSAVCMPNTSPAIDNEKALKDLINRIKKSSHIKIYPAAAISKGSKSEEKTEFEKLRKAGAAAFSDDGMGVSNAGIMREALLFSAKTGVPVFCHEEDMSLTKNGVMASGKISGLLKLPGIPPESESSMVARDIAIAAHNGGSLHICHISSAMSVEIVRAAKAMGVNVTCEVTPHHLTLNDESVKNSGSSPNTKMKPPLMPEADRKALVAALDEDVIDCIATDHAPHSKSEKGSGFSKAPFGIIGFETAFPVLFTELVLKKKIDLETLLMKMTFNPAKILGIKAGLMSKGAPADIVIIDLNKRWTITDKFYSKSGNSPYIGKKVCGKISITIADGKRYIF